MLNNGVNGTALKAPFPYFGGKSKIAPDVWRCFGNIANYVEPFFGSGAVLFNRPHEPKTETVNDIDCYLANFWRTLRCDPDGLAEWADWPVNECVPAGTMIATPNGNVPVENIRPGMTVWGERDGKLTRTTVIATKQSETANPLFEIGDLLLTGNHPVWTSNGYIEAEHIRDDMIIGLLPNSPVDELDLVMLQYRNESTTVDNLHSIRSQEYGGSLCGCDIPPKTALQRTYLKSHNWWQDASRLLDSFVDCGWDSPTLPSYSEWDWRGVARGGTPLDSVLSFAIRLDQSDRWWRRDTWHYPNTRTQGEMVKNARRNQVCSWSCVCDEGQEAYAGSCGENSQGWNWTQAQRAIQSAIICHPHREDAFGRSQAETFGSAFRENAIREPQAENSSHHNQQKSCSVCGDWSNIPLNHRSGKNIESLGSLNQPGHSQRWPMQGQSSAICLSTTVYNFQTTSGNYFANRILVHNCDLHARHLWLLNRSEFRQRMKTDPDYYDAKIAGWWVWGICQWIGSGWCAGDYYGENSAAAWKARPHLSSAGMGIHRPSQRLPHLGNAGMGTHRPSNNDLLAYFHALAARLRRVRVCCGDWSRVLGDSVTHKHGLTAVFLDPPYSHAVRDDSLYGQDHDVAADVRQWAIENGDNPLLRIALCGYDNEHTMPDNWTLYRWKATGGYGVQGEGAGRENANRECVWFSAHCIDLRKPKQAQLFEATA